jgi:hypothetical protein
MAAHAVTLTVTTTGDQLDVPGVISGDVVIEPRRCKVKRTTFFGVHGETEITGGRSGRAIHIPVLIQDASAFDTARKLADFIDYTVGTTALQKNGTLDFVSASDHSKFLNCTFDGVEFEPGHSVKQDIGGTAGGGWIAYCILHFYQLTDGAAETP